jgi:hypothetical protein
LDIGLRAGLRDNLGEAAARLALAKLPQDFG